MVNLHWVNLFKSPSCVTSNPHEIPSKSPTVRMRIPSTICARKFEKSPTGCCV